MKSPSSSRSVLIGLAVLALVAGIGVIWGLNTRDGADRAVAAEQPVTPTLLPAEETTISTLAEVTTTSTTPSTTTTSGASSQVPRSSSPAPTTTLPNQAPSFEDLVVTSDGMRVTVNGLVHDPDGDDVTVWITQGGLTTEAVTGASPLQFERSIPAVSEEEDTFTVEIGIHSSDQVGNETAEFVLHEVKAVTTVTLRDVSFRLNGSSSCGASARLTGVLRLMGAISEDVEFNHLLPTDRTPVVLVDEVAGSVVGQPTSLEILLVANAGGNADTYEKPHTKTDPDGVLVSLFRLTECAGTLTYNVEFERR